ncbi:hypothetical protein DEO72_LG7g1454 [Vigna unguiculata]|uniref:Uncharacterized protein n=1 Tax=Vigna unguiculata TaxID=3917 RepID=A0A4D6MJJ6_VIGUN|nr:hypothetical protein DEO72_LG7g1454 [Vigna unguiculata]
MLGPLQHTMEYMSWYTSNSCIYLSVPQMLNDPIMHRQSTSTNVPPPPQTTHDLNTPPSPQGMEGTRNSVSPNSELGIPSLHQPQQDSIYYVHNPYTQASSSVEEHERQPSQVEEPRPEVRRRNPTRNRRRPRCGIGHHYGD